MSPHPAAETAYEEVLDRAADRQAEDRSGIPMCGCEQEPHTCTDGDEPAPRKKRKKGTSPTARTLAECRKRGLIVQVVERWNQHARVRQDLFGVIDLVAIVEARPPFGTGDAAPGAILGIQACAGASHAARRDKILAEPRARQWVEAGGRLELWSWSKRGDRGKQKRWTLRVEAFTVENWRTP